MLTSGGGGSYGDDLINPTYFPCKSATLDTSLITGSGDKVAAIGTQVLTTTQAAETSWKGLQSPGVFETPDSEVVYALMQPAVKGATDMNGVTGRLSTALHTYAAELEAIKPDLADLEERATKFRERAQKGYEVSNWEARGWLSNFETGLDGNAVPRADADEMTTISWKEHGPARDKNESLLHEYDMILERISAAATTCANAIQRELKMVCVAPAEKITAEMLEASDLSVWGKASEEKRNCTESVGHGLGNFWHNTWTGAASLIGRDATTGEWSWETAGKTWWGVGDFVVSTLVVTSPISALLLTNEQGRSFYNDRANVAASSWGGLIGWDHQAHLAGENGWHRYEEDGVAALTESVANVGTFFIPVAGAAAGGTKAVLAGTRVGSFVAKTASHVAEFVIPAGSYLVKGAVKVIDLGVDLTKGGWRGLVDSLTPGPVRPNALPGITGVATEAPHTPLPSKTPVSSSLGLEGAPPMHGSNTPGGGHVPDGSAPHGGPDGPPLPERPGGEPQLGNQWGDQQPGGQHSVDPAPNEPHPTDPHPADPIPADPHPGADGTGDHTGSGLDSDTRDRIIEMEKGSRPLPETYLSPEYIREHLQKFDGGATRFMTESNLSKYGIGQRDGTAFVMPTAEVDALLRSVNGDMRKFEAALGLPDGFFDTNKVVRVDIANPAGEGLRMPSGNEAGANSQWLPGGKLPTGISEAVIDIPGDGSLKYGVQPMGGHAGSAVDIPDALTTVERGESHIVGGRDGVVPDNLLEFAEDRVEAVAKADAASTQFDTAFKAFNEALSEQGLQPVARREFTSGRVDKTIPRLLDEFEDYPELQGMVFDIESAANARQEALSRQTDIGEQFGEAAGEYAAREDGLQEVLVEKKRPSGTVDQAFKTKDNTELVIQEVKGPSADLGKMNVIGSDGQKVPASQGSEAYLRDILRKDTKLRDRVLSDPALREGLLNGTTTLRYRLVKPNRFGRVTVTEFLINNSTLDISGWLNG